MYKQTIRNLGEWAKVASRKLVLWGEDETPRWTSELLQSAYMVDAEIHLGGSVFRGPLYAMHQDFLAGDSLILKFNWIAKRSAFGGAWTYFGWCSFRLTDFGPPHFIKKDGGDKRRVGDVWFFFRGGYAVICFGHPREALAFRGVEETLRVYGYF